MPTELITIRKSKPLRIATIYNIKPSIYKCTKRTCNLSGQIRTKSHTHTDNNLKRVEYSPSVSFA